MHVVRERDVARFLARVGPFLGERPAENNLMLGLLGDLVRGGLIPGLDVTPAPPVLLVVEGARGIESIALQTPPRAIILSRASDEATDAILAHVLGADLALPGVLGPDRTAERFASSWCARTGRAAVLRMAETIYELVRVRPPAACPGRLREATGADENLLVPWFDAFNREAEVDMMQDTLAFVRGKMAAQQLFVWDTGALVSMAAWGGRTAHGVRIGFVYTPPAERKNGYASASVAALCQRLLDEGSPRCFLFANAANATSNKIYQALGFEAVSDFRWYDFSAP